MAFHVACPITCRRICDCELGFGDGLRGERARGKFVAEIAALEEFLKDPWTVRVGVGGGGEGEGGTVQVPVPRVVPQQRVVRLAAGDGAEREKRAALQREAAAASVAAEDYVRKLEIGAADVDLLGEAPSPHAREDQGSSLIKIICRICFSGENEGSTKAQKMLSCKICGKKYHKSCLRSWAEHRDLFHWSSWTCPSCRICEVCQSAGDPNKLMFCKRCDGAFHCYCQQPPHKNVSHGPYVCSKHTRCHSCGSTVPGNGPSTRWFLGYTCCDACGRLFVKGNYCPVCLKVYRDSETTPMVCCDICERWIHCACDGISDEKYQQFQADQNLQYTCAACRGDCYQVKDTDDAVRELWKRKDVTECKLIAGLRAAAGLPSQEEASPYSDDEQSYPVTSKNDYGRSLKFSVKGFSDKLTKSSSNNSVSKNILPSKSPTKKTIKFVSNAEGPYKHYEKQNGERSLNSAFTTDGSEIQHVESNQYSTIKESGGNVDRVSRVQNESRKIQGLHFKESSAKTASKNETIKGTKLVIHLGSKNRNLSSSPKSETSSCHKEQDVTASYGIEDTSDPKTNDSENHMHEARSGTVRHDVKGSKFDNTNLRRSLKHRDGDENDIKVGIVSDRQRKRNGSLVEDKVLVTCTSTAVAAEAAGEFGSESDDDVVLLKKKQPTGLTIPYSQIDGGQHASRLKFVSSAAINDPKPLLKLKFKNPYFEQRSSWASRGEEENTVKGQRSKRKRPSTTEKFDAGAGEEDSSAKLTDKEMEANWILQKLGKDAIGKRVEVHHPSDNSWRKGVVSDVTIQGGSSSSSSLLVLLDDGRSTTLDLGKQAVRFASQKQNKRAKTRN